MSSSLSSGHTHRALDSARVLRPDERERLRAFLEGQLALAKTRGAWRAYRVPIQ